MKTTANTPWSMKDFGPTKWANSKGLCIGKKTHPTFRIACQEEDIDAVFNFWDFYAVGTRKPRMNSNDAGNGTGCGLKIFLSQSLTSITRLADLKEMQRWRKTNGVQHHC